MKRFGEAKIYKLVCDDPGKCYVGATTCTLPARLSRHDSDARYNKTCCSKELYKYGNVQIELIEDYPCDNQTELDIREGYWIRNTPGAINKQLPDTYSHITGEGPQKKKDKDAYYYQQNRKKIIAKVRERYAEKKDEILAYHRNRREKLKNETFECGCGSKVCRTGLPQHKRSLRHKKWIETGIKPHGEKYIGKFTKGAYPVEIYIDGKKKYIGRYYTLDKAIEARDKALQQVQA